MHAYVFFLISRGVEIIGTLYLDGKRSILSLSNKETIVSYTLFIACAAIILSPGLVMAFRKEPVNVTQEARRAR